MKLSTLKAQIRAGTKKEDPSLWLSTGLTLLNLACSGRRLRALRAGGFYLFIGDSSAGKTLLTGNCLAEAAISPKFEDYDLYFDDVEGGAFMFEKFLSEKIRKRIRPPGHKGTSSKTVEENYSNHHRVIAETRAKKKKGVVYATDSENALRSEAEIKKVKKTRSERDNNKESAGTMTDGKAVFHSRNLRELIADVRDSDSISIMLCQTREAMGFGAQYEPKTRSGGKALKFYANLEMWFSIVKKLTKLVRGVNREIGVLIQIRVKKNRFTGKNRTVEIPIYYSVGCDEVGANINYLMKEGEWKKSSGVIDAKEFRVKMKYNQLIKHIEDENLEAELSKIVERVWNEIEAESEVHRKSKYL